MSRMKLINNYVPFSRRRTDYCRTTLCATETYKFLLLKCEHNSVSWRRMNYSSLEHNIVCNRNLQGFIIKMSRGPRVEQCCLQQKLTSFYYQNVNTTQSREEKWTKEPTKRYFCSLFHLDEIPVFLFCFFNQRYTK